MSFWRVLVAIFILASLLYFFEKYLAPDEIKSQLPLAKLALLLPTSTTVDPVAAVREDAQKEFTEYTSRLLLEMPKIQDLKSIKGFSAHQMPQPLLKAAAQLGELKDMISQNSNLKQPAFEFYRNCAYQEDLALTVRALCFKNASELHLDLFNEDWRYSAESVSVDVIQLAEKL